MLANVTYERGTGGVLHELKNVTLLTSKATNLTPIELEDGRVLIVNNRFIVEVEAL